MGMGLKWKEPGDTDTITITIHRVEPSAQALARLSYHIISWRKIEGKIVFFLPSMFFQLFTHIA